jgi:hypothetical protein
MASSDKRAAYGKGGLYKRSVFEKDERGKVVLDRRGNPVVKYDYWQATFEIPAEDLPDGVRRRRLTGNATNKSAALAALRENIDAFYERKRNGEPTYRTPRKRGAKRYTIDDLFTLWLQRKTDEALRPTVIRKYRRMYEQHIQPVIGKEFLDKITDQQLLLLLNSTLVVKKKTDREGRAIPGTRLLGAPARLNIWKILRMAFLWAHRKDLLGGRSNPMMLVPQPKVEKRLIDIDARVADAEVVMKYLEKSRPDLLCLFGFQYLGLRQNERLGLLTTDILGLGTKHPKLVISHQLARRETSEMEDDPTQPRWYLAPTKTGVKREIPLTEPFLGYLTGHLKRREENKKRADYNKWEKGDELGELLFLTERGHIINKNPDNALWKRVCLEAGVQPFPQHINRFITAARLAELDPPVSANVVRAILGHESEAIGYYYQRITSANSEAALRRYGERMNLRKRKSGID